MTKRMIKPWYQSLTIKGALVAGLGVLLHPAVLGLLPPKWATAIATVGGVASAIGLRRAIPPA